MKHIKLLKISTGLLLINLQVFSQWNCPIITVPSGNMHQQMEVVVQNHSSEDKFKSPLLDGLIKGDTAWYQHFSKLFDNDKNIFSNGIIKNKINLRATTQSDCNNSTINESLYNTTCSFGMFIKSDTIFVGSYVIDPNVLGLNTVLGAGIELYFNSDSVKRKLQPNFTTTSPIAYDVSSDIRIIIPYLGNQVHTFNGATLSIFGKNLPYSDAFFVVSPTKDGYSVEGFIIRTVLGIIDNYYSGGSNKYGLCQDYTFGFDIANNISNGNERVAQTMWNNALYNRNWLESYNFGYIYLRFNPYFTIGCNAYELFIYPTINTITANTNFHSVTNPRGSQNAREWKIESQSCEGSAKMNTLTGFFRSI